MKPSGVSVDKFLAEAAGSGAFDSQGVFTIAGEAAIGKLASFQLPRKSAWVLKAIQCAVAWGATAIKAQQTTDATYIGFASEGEFDVAGLEKALLDVEHDGACYLEHLACGLRAVGFGDKRPFSVQVHRDETLDSYRWDGKELFRERLSIPKVASCTVHLTVDFPSEDKGRWLGGLVRSAGRASDEYLELVERAEVCPIPLTVDGRRIDTLTGAGRKHESTVAELCLSWKEPPPDSNSPTLSLPQGVQLEPSAVPLSDSFTDQGPLLVDGDPSQRRTLAIARLAYHYKVLSHRGKHSSFKFEGRPQFSNFHWVSDGVICQSGRFQWDLLPVTLDLYLPATGLPTDLSGLTLRADAAPQQKARLRVGMAQVKPSLEHLRLALDAHRSLPFGAHTLMWGGMGLVMGVVVPGVGKLVTLAVAGVSLAQSASDKASIVKNCKTNLAIMEQRVSIYRAEAQQLT